MLTSVTNAIRSVVASLELDEVGKARAALALRLAEVLDSGQSLMATAAISKELRETLAELTGEGGHDERLDKLIAGLSAPIQHAS